MNVNFVRYKKEEAVDKYGLSYYVYDIDIKRFAQGIAEGYYKHSINVDVFLTGTKVEPLFYRIFESEDDATSYIVKKVEEEINHQYDLNKDHYLHLRKHIYYTLGILLFDKAIRSEFFKSLKCMKKLSSFISAIEEKKSLNMSPKNQIYSHKNENKTWTVLEKEDFKAYYLNLGGEEGIDDSYQEPICATIHFVKDGFKYIDGIYHPVFVANKIDGNIREKDAKLIINTGFTYHKPSNIEETKEIFEFPSSSCLYESEEDFNEALQYAIEDKEKEAEKLKCISL